MNFDDIKKELDDSVAGESLVASTPDKSRGINNPVQRIRSNMKKEIITQLLAILIFMIYPLYVGMPHFSEAVYYIFMFIMSIMTVAYILKLSVFLKKTSGFVLNTKDAIQHFIYEARLALEVYKSFTIAGSLLLPIPVFALLAGFKLSGDQLLVEKWFLLEITSTQLFLLIIGYLLIAILFYFITLSWTKFMYGKYLKKLDSLLDQFEED